MTPPLFHHVAINCLDLDKMESFYCRYFGFQRARTVPLGGSDKILFLKHGNVYLELFKATGPSPHAFTEKDGPPWAGMRHLAFQVEDVDAALAALGTAVKINLGPLRFDAFIPGWCAVWVLDPEGNVIELSHGYQDEINPSSQ